MPLKHNSESGQPVIIDDYNGNIVQLLPGTMDCCGILFQLLVASFHSLRCHFSLNLLLGLLRGYSGSIAS